MNRKEILTKFEDLIKELFPDFQPIKGDWMSQDWRQLGFDELDITELAMATEGDFNIPQMPHEIFRALQCPKDVFTYLKDHLIEKPEPVYEPKMFFTSDLHLGHHGICKGTSKWDNIKACRDFQTVEEMDDAIVNNINNTVGENDILWCLGDFAITNAREWKKLRDRIICKNIHLVLGNHDPQRYLLENKWINSGDTGFHIGDLFYSVQHVKMLSLKIDGKKQQIFLSHYSHRTWDLGQDGAWMLYGHSHGSLEEYSVLEQFYWKPYMFLVNHFIKTPKKFKTMDVGIDTHPDFRPYSLEELSHIMQSRVNLDIDHHKELRGL